MQVMLEGVCAQQRPWLMVLAFCNNGDLLGHLEKMRKRKRPMQLNERLRAAIDIAQGLAYVAAQVSATWLGTTGVPDLRLRNDLLISGTYSQARPSCSALCTWTWRPVTACCTTTWHRSPTLV